MTYGKQYGVSKYLRDNFHCKAKWEDERTNNILNIK